MFKSSMLLLLAAAPVAAAGAGFAAVPEPAVADPDFKVRAPTLPVITDGPELLASFGGRAGLVGVMDDAMARWLANPRTRQFFADSRPASRPSSSSNSAW